MQSAPATGAVQAAHPGRAALAFALLFTAVFLAPPYTPWTFGPFPLMRWGDVIDLLTPVVMLPAYWFLLALRSPPSRARTAAFLVLAAIWVEGQGVHLAANSIGHLVESGEGGRLANFYDEHLGHLLWHGAALALSLLAVLDAAPAAAPAERRLALAAAAVYGFAFFLIAVEGATSVLAVAGGLLVTGVVLRRGLRDMLGRPAAVLFGAGYPVMLVLLATWFVYWGGRLPEFSQLGLIK